MVYRFSRTSKANLAWVHPDLVQVMYAALNHPDCPFDFGITEGARPRALQKALVESGASWTLESRHLLDRSLNGSVVAHAVDIAIWLRKRLTWEFEPYRIMSEHILKVADGLAVPLTWGGSWESRDGPHYELPKGAYAVSAYDNLPGSSRTLIDTMEHIHLEQQNYG